MCEACSIQRSQDGPWMGFNFHDCAEILRARFAEQAVFDAFGALPYPHALWVLQMIEHILEHGLDETKSDKAICRRFDEPGNQSRTWLVRQFPQFDGAEVISAHESSESAIVVDFAFRGLSRERRTPSIFEALYKPFLRKAV